MFKVSFSLDLLCRDKNAKEHLIEVRELYHVYHVYWSDILVVSFILIQTSCTPSLPYCIASFHRDPIHPPTPENVTIQLRFQGFRVD